MAGDLLKPLLLPLLAVRYVEFAAAIGFNDLLIRGSLLQTVWQLLVGDQKTDASTTRL